MANVDIEEFQLYFSRLRPIYHQLFNLAHAVTGNCEQAEYCLQYAMLDCWTSGNASASRHGFREALRSCVVHAALRTALSAGDSDTEFDWDGLRAEGEAADPILRLISQETPETRRMLALRYGGGLSLRHVARLTHCDAARVRTLLRRFGARARRRLSAADRRRCDTLIVHAVREQLSRPCPLAPEMGNVFRTFQADAASLSRPSHLHMRILRAALTVLLALVCVAAFWFAAVLMQPVALENSASPETAQETPVE